MLQNGETNAPFGILSKFNNGWHECLGEDLEANHLVDTLDVRDDIQPHLGTVVFEEN